MHFFIAFHGISWHLDLDLDYLRYLEMKLQKMMNVMFFESEQFIHFRMKQMDHSMKRVRFGPHLSRKTGFEELDWSVCWAMYRPWNKHSNWRSRVGKRISFWDGMCSGAILVPQRVQVVQCNSECLIQIDGGYSFSFSSGIRIYMCLIDLIVWPT